MADPWKPGNYRGTIHADPRDELRSRVEIATLVGDSAIAISLPLAYALAELRECNSMTTLNGDEDGPLTPMLVRCRKPTQHFGMHFNGSYSWGDQ